MLKRIKDFFKGGTLPAAKIPRPPYIVHFPNNIRIHFHITDVRITICLLEEKPVKLSYAGEHGGIDLIGDYTITLSPGYWDISAALYQNEHSGKFSVKFNWWRMS